MNKVSQRKRFILWVIVAFALNYGLDRVTKIVAVDRLADGSVHSFLGGAFVLRFAENTGAFLSMGNDWNPILKTIVLIALPLAVCLYGLWWALAREPRLAKAIVIATVVAGGMANLQDRIFRGFRVVDFLNFGIGPSFRTGILNVADMSVTFGVIVWLFMEIADARKAKTDNNK